MDQKELTHFLDDDGRLISWPAKPKKQMLALQFLAGKLEWDRHYSEQEINELLTKFHTFEDAALLRRELYMKHFLDRKADGSAYWKTPRLLRPLWNTQRFTMRDAVEADVPALQKIYDDCAYIGDLTGYHDDRKDPILMEVRHEALPPNGRKELHRIQLIMNTETQEIAGYLIVYHGFPDPDTFWIALFAIHPPSHRKGIGSEVIQELKKQAADLGTFTRIGLGIGIGNVVAKAFWTNCGFIDVIKIEHHGTHSDEWVVQSLVR